jgi:thymidine phosphorylase
MFYFTYENKKYRYSGNIGWSRKRKKDTIYYSAGGLFYKKRNDYVEKGLIPAEFLSSCISCGVHELKILP